MGLEALHDMNVTGALGQPGSRVELQSQCAVAAVFSLLPW